MENDDCTLKSQGSYIINDTRGHIFEIKNGLSYDTIFYWDSLSRNLTSISHKKRIFVPSMSFRYIDTGIHDTHIVRLFINYDNQFELIDKTIGHDSKKLGTKKNIICDYLFRLCYLNKKFIDEDLYLTNNSSDPTNKTIDNSKCTEYENICDQFKKKPEDDICIDTCITTYYGHLLGEKEKILPNFDRLNLVQCIIENQKKDFSALDNYPKIYPKTTSDTTEKQRLETTITVLSILFTISLIFIFIIIFYWARKKYQNYTYKKGTIISDSGHTEPDATNFI
jgi:hypothetical protein